jgi:hypothetical protein
MEPEDFRQIILHRPNAVEAVHMGHPDFRVSGKVFATLGYPTDEWGMVKLTPDQQKILVNAESATFTPAKGAWGRRGSTQVFLAALDSETAKNAVQMAWANVAIK